MRRSNNLTVYEKHNTKNKKISITQKHTLLIIKRHKIIVSTQKLISVIIVYKYNYITMYNYV